MGGVCISIHALGPQDQLLVTTLTGKKVYNGPGVHIVGLLKTGRKRQCPVLGPGEYAIIKTTTTGELSRVVGPILLQLGPYDEVISRENAITLERNEYVRLIDEVTGQIRVEVGEAIEVPSVRSRERGEDPVMQELQEQLSGMLERLAAEIEEGRRQEGGRN